MDLDELEKDTLIAEHGKMEKELGTLATERDGLKTQVEELQGKLKTAEDSVKARDEAEASQLREFISSSGLDSYSKEEIDKMGLAELRVASDTFKRVLPKIGAVDVQKVAKKLGDSTGDSRKLDPRWNPQVK